MKPWWVTGAWVLFALAAAVVELWPAEELIGIDDSSMETGRGWCLLLCARLWSMICAWRGHALPYVTVFCCDFVW